MSKGSNRRPTDAEAFNNNFDAIFGRKSCCGHDSDCAVHNEPAYPAGPCDCKPPQGYTAEELERDNPYNQWMNEE